MPKSKAHTIEPWKVGESHETMETITNAQGAPIARTIRGFASSLTGCDGNADRIVACVNACAGVPTEQLRNMAEMIRRDNEEGRL